MSLFSVVQYILYDTTESAFKNRGYSSTCIFSQLSTNKGFLLVG